MRVTLRQLPFASLLQSLCFVKSKMITLVRIQGNLRKPNLQLNKQNAVLTEEFWQQVHRAL